MKGDNLVWILQLLDLDRLSWMIYRRLSVVRRFRGTVL